MLVIRTDFHGTGAGKKIAEKAENEPYRRCKECIPRCRTWQGVNSRTPRYMIEPATHLRQESGEHLVFNLGHHQHSISNTSEKSITLAPLTIPRSIQTTRHCPLSSRQMGLDCGSALQVNDKNLIPSINLAVCASAWQSPATIRLCECKLLRQAFRSPP
eukprot:762521-Hanusia_phi.AAC.3